MTWKQFKEAIDKKIQDDDEIWYIDVSYPDGENLTIGESDALFGVNITN